MDLDTCRTPDGTLAPWATEVVERFRSYSEVSPSGTGTKIFFSFDPADIPALRTAMGTDHGKMWKRPGGGEHPPAIELHLSNRYFAVTAQHMPGTPLDFAFVPLDTLLWLIREAGPAFAENKASEGALGASREDVALGDLLVRIKRKTTSSGLLARRWAGEWSGLTDNSRSGKAMALCAALKGAGFNFAEIRAALQWHVDTRDWMETKGLTEHGRELQRIWNKVGNQNGTIGTCDIEVEPQDWPVPQCDLATRDPLPPPSFPLKDVFPNPWVAWIEPMAEAKGAAVDYVAGAILTVVGALIGNSRRGSPWAEWSEPTPLWVALVGAPPSGKSPGMDAAVDPLTALEAAINEDWDERRRDYQTSKHEAAEKKAQWQAEVKEAVKLGTPPPLMPEDAEEPPALQRRRIFSTDPTVAKAERMSAANPHGLILIRDEMAGWIAGMDRFTGAAGSDRAFYLHAFGGQVWAPDRVKDGDSEIYVPHLLWGILGTIQPDRLARVVMGGDDDGMAARFLYFWPAPRKPRRPPAGVKFPPAGEWLARLRFLPWQEPNPVTLEFEEAARVALQDWRDEVARLEEGATGLFLSWVGKLPGFAVRLAVILAHMEWCCSEFPGEPPSIIRETDVLRAVTFLADYAMPMAQRAFGEAALPEPERDARKVARWLVSQDPVPIVINARELRRMANGPGIPTAGRITAALTELAELHLVRRAPQREGGGRSRDDWQVNPHLRGAVP